MDFSFSPELTAYQAQIFDWARNVARPLARQADADHRLPANTGAVLDSCPVPLDRVDGVSSVLPTFPDGDLLRNTAIVEALTYGDPWLFEATNRGIGHHVVGQAGTPEQANRWYAPYARPGARSTGFGMTEPGMGSDTSGIATTARRDEENWVLNGSKIYCSLGAHADFIVIIATIDPQLKHAGIRAFVVEKDTPGLIITRPNESKLGLRCWMTTALTLEDCRIPLDHMLGWKGEDANNDDLAKTLGRALSSFNYSRPLVGLMGLSIAKAAVEETRELLERRRDKFSDHRWAAIEGDLDQMTAAYERGRLLCYQGIWLDAQRRSNRIEAAAAKAYSPVAAELIIRRCMQILGPQGASEAHLIEKWYRDIKIFDIFEGTGQIMRRLVSKSLMGPQAAG
ncbi:acyl-CoA dehydrogenase [Aliidongia dinghuensis]|uniref:Acyl-CoA dehydrogenase n=1 Tax=Aliidongia dinghuensis TaxID=1867774 RepID=A0A8J2Z080_9PROT|nr:acyl-CoA dehydrogenase [Aliidongia dinghuensis]GGF49403.1 acyl-CoA dehydrogenase [Aliidongia dinghuensis]